MCLRSLFTVLLASTVTPSAFASTDALEPVLVQVQSSHTIDELLDGLQVPVQVVRRLPVSGLVAVQVDPKDLSALRASPMVEGLHADVLLVPVGREEANFVGVPRAFSIGGSGFGASVAVLDTGVDSDHPMLGGRLLPGACFSSDLGDSRSVCGEAEPGGVIHGADGMGHGTHVAGIVSSVAHAADIMSVQVFSEFSDSCSEFGLSRPCLLAWTHDVIAGLELVLDDTSVDAVNLSLGSGIEQVCNDSPYAVVIGELTAAGTAVIASAGNAGGVSGLSQPACVSAVIAVGASDLGDSPAAFSQMGVSLDLFAPGVDVLSTVPGGYGTMSGTSMAAPHVAGAIAVLRSLVPDASVEEMEAVLKATGSPVRHAELDQVTPRIRVDHAAWVLSR